MIGMNSRREYTTPLVVLAMLVVVSAGSLGAVAAQDSPGEPHNFYGSVANDAGDPAPEGVEIFALIDGEVQDSIVVNDSGEYGGPEAFDDKLTVDDGAGTEVVFRVGSPDGPEALESPYDLSEADGSVTELDLTFPEGAFVESPPSFQVSIDEAASTLEAESGGNLTVVASVENAGEASGTQAITATVADDTVGVENVSLDAGANATAEFTVTAEAAYDGEAVEVASENDSATATLSVADDGSGSDGASGGPGGDDTGSDTDGDGSDDGGSDDGDGSDGSDGSDDGGGADDGSTDGDDSDGSDGSDDGGDDDGSDDGDDGDDGTPGFGILLGAAGVLGSALLLRRRR